MALSLLCPSLAVAQPMKQNGTSASSSPTSVSLTGASTITNASFTASGPNGNIISASSITTTSGLFGGSLSVSGSTLTVGSNGALFVPSQPRAILRLTTAKVFSGEQPVFWNTIDKVVNINFDQTNSSSAVVIATGMGGAYDMFCSLTWTAGVVTDNAGASIWVNGAAKARANGNLGTAGTEGNTLAAFLPGYELVATDSVVCKAYSNAAGGGTVNANNYNATFSVMKR
jgi:hypothetical protein